MVVLLAGNALPLSVIIEGEKAGSDRYYGLVADNDYLLVCEYGCNGSDPEIVVYRKR